VVGEELRVLIEEPVVRVGVDPQVRVRQSVGEEPAVLVCIIVSLSPTATKVGCVMPASRSSFDGSGFPTQ
jgi:hypothetical protein